MRVRLSPRLFARRSSTRRDRTGTENGEPVAEADGNRTRRTQLLGPYGFEDRARHQTRNASAGHPKPLLAGDVDCGSDRVHFTS